MNWKVFLQKFNGKTASSKSGGVDIQFKGRRKLLPSNDVAEVISLYDQYMSERASCNIIRLTCQVNPICSNILFNKITEIVKNEGSDDVSFINYGVANNNDFNGVKFKESTIDFWSGNSTDSIKQNNSINHPTNAIRDMQLSNNNNNFIYHCGIDVFNNHLLRSNTFKTVCKKLNKGNKSDTFNTIADIMRDAEGNEVSENIYYPVSAPQVQKEVTLHLYEYDDIYTYNDAVKNRLIKKYNGWVGFENKSKIKSYSDFVNNDDMNMERPLMYMNGGDFVDMYPSRDLYSFIPKYNTFRHRVEKNWNYCITYPSSSYTPSDENAPFSDVIESTNGLNSLKAIYFNENTKSDNGASQLVVYSIAKHGLSVGDYVNIYATRNTKQYWVVDKENRRMSDYFTNETDANDMFETMRHNYDMGIYCGSNDASNEPFKVVDSVSAITVNDLVCESVEVKDVIDDYIFTVFNSDKRISNDWIEISSDALNSESEFSVNGVEYVVDGTNKKTLIRKDNNKRYYIINNSYANVDDNAQDISFKRVVGGIECEYYIRIFSKLPNFKFASGDTSNEYELYKNNEEIIKTYQDKKYDFENHISKLAFAKNIYTDGVGEIVFTDNIDISSLHDNLGRPLSSIYLTILKNNKGYQEWYGYNYANNVWDEKEINDSAVEYSHAFGKLTCGLETSVESIFSNKVNSINRINNIELNHASGYKLKGIITPIDRKYMTDSGKEVMIDDNEIWYDSDTSFYGDLCCYDPYNVVERPISNVMYRFNSAQREAVRSQANAYFGHFLYDEIIRDDYDGQDEYSVGASTNTYNCHDKKEGYYYNPHYEIKIRTFDKVQYLIPSFLTIRKIESKGDGIYQIVTLQQHFLSMGDKAVIYDKIEKKYYDLIVINGQNDNYNIFTCKVYKENSDEKCEIKDEDKSYYKLFKMDNIDCPSHAKILKDGTCRIVWRNILNNGFAKGDDTVEEYPFTNGAFYVNKRIDLYLRRQDPYGDYWIYSEDDIEGITTDISVEDNYFTNEDIEGC